MKKVLLSAVLIIVLSTLSHAQWVMQASGFPNESTGAFYISVVNKDIVWISARDGLNAPYISNEFSRTVDGGVTWVPGQVIPGVAKYDISNISAVNADTAWADIYRADSAQDSHCGIYKTTDGGVTWFQQFSIQPGTGSFANNVHFWNANEGMWHGDQKDGYFEIYTTSDGGTTWVRVPQSDINATVMQGEKGIIRAFNTTSDSMIYFLTTKTRVYISTDRGHHWVARSTGITYPANCWYANVAFHDASHGLVGYASGAASSMTLRETSDGGNTWSLTYSSGPVNCFALDAVPGSPNTYVTTGQNASMKDMMPETGTAGQETDAPTHVNSGVTYSFDGGHTWQKMTGTDNKHFLGIQFLNDSVSFAGSWNNNPVNDGMYKFTSSLAEANFTASDSMINVGDQVTFSIISGGHSTSTFLWTFEGGSPATSTSRNPVVTYDTKGLYSVTLKVTNSWGTSTKTKTPYIYAGCGVGMDNTSSSAVSVFPNPIDDVLKIEGNAPILKARICDLTGREVLSKNIGDSRANIPVRGLKPGVYNLIIFLNDGTVNRKIVIR